MSRKGISVTEVRNALRCPRIFALGRSRKKAVAFPVGSSCLGSAFHRIVDRFAQTVLTPPPYFEALSQGAPMDEVQRALVRWILDLLVGELEANPALSSMPAEVDDLAEALRQLAAHLAERTLAFGVAPLVALRALMQGGERDVEAVLEETGTLLRGRIDALYATADGALHVVEYKLTDEANERLDRAQVVLYRDLLRRSEGLVVEPVLLRFNPELSVTHVAPGVADALVQRELLPLLKRMEGWADDPSSAPATERRDLCGACPVAAACRETYPMVLGPRDDPPGSAARPHPSPEGVLEPPVRVDPPPQPDDAVGAKEAQALEKRILSELKREGIPAHAPQPPVVGPTVYVISVSRKRGSVRQLDSAARDVLHRLASEGLDGEYMSSGGRRAFTFRRPTPRAVLLGPLLTQKHAWLAERPGRFVIGQRPDGGVLHGDLSDSATPHLLIGGQAGSGKSWLLRALVASLVHFHGPDAVRITLVDPKRVTFNTAFRTAMAAHLDGPVLYDVEMGLPCVARFVDVMEDRYARFEAEQVSDLVEYNDAVPPENRLARHVVVIDEFQDLIADKKAAAAFESAVTRLGAKARAAGVHLVLATQRPDRDTVSGKLKANLGGKIALRVASAVNSKIILDHGGAEKLLGKGDLLADLGHGLVRAQAAVASV